MKRRIARALALAGLAAAGLAGCADQPPKEPRPPRLISTDFDPDIMLVGYDVAKDLSIDGTAQARLRTNIDRATHEEHHQVYMVLLYYGRTWQTFATATDANRQPLKVIQISRTPGKCGVTHYECMYIETIAALVPDKDLRAAAGIGYQLQIRSKAGDAEVIAVTPDQIRAQLAAVDPLLMK